MRSRILIVAALAVLFLGGLMAGEAVKASAGSKQLRFGFSRFAVFTPSTLGVWENVASASVTSKRDNGSCHVSASGMSFLPAGGQLTLTLDTTPGTRGPWVFSYGNESGTAQEARNFNVEMVFGDVPGPNITNTFYLNATFFSGPGGADIQMGAMTAMALQNPLTEDCDPGIAFAPGDEPGGNFGNSNVDPFN